MVVFLVYNFPEHNCFPINFDAVLFFFYFTMTLQMKAFCHTGDVQAHSTHVWTAGLHTCMFLCVHTRFGYIGWHFNSDNMEYGTNMKRIDTLLSGIKTTDVRGGFLVPGHSRDTSTLALKPDCRTLRLRPATDPTKSRDFLLTYLKQFPWFQRIIIWRRPLDDPKDIVCLRGFELQICDGTAFHRDNCIADAASMI